jgi:thymidine kinase
MFFYHNMLQPYHMSAFVASHSSQPSLKPNGYLELVIAPMFSGKSSEIIKTISRFESIGKKILAINHSFNNRYNSTGISTHNGMKYENCITLSNLSSISTDSKQFVEADVIIIEELQFFEDAVENITDWVDCHKKYVFAVGLSGDFNRKPFAPIANLIPLCDKLTKLDAFCKICGDGTCASFSKKIVGNSDKIVEVGADDIYVATCRKHYLEK